MHHTVRLSWVVQYSKQVTHLSQSHTETHLISILRWWSRQKSLFSESYCYFKRTHSFLLVYFQKAISESAYFSPFTTMFTRVIFCKQFTTSAFSFTLISYTMWINSVRLWLFCSWIFLFMVSYPNGNILKKIFVFSPFPYFAKNRYHKFILLYSCYTNMH